MWWFFGGLIVEGWHERHMRRKGEQREKLPAVLHSTLTNSVHHGFFVSGQNKEE